MSPNCTPLTACTTDVVFDINVYLRIAEVLGKDRCTLERLVGEAKNTPLGLSNPTRHQAATITVAWSLGRRFVNGSDMRVFASTWIESGVRHLAGSSPWGPDKGLGWTLEQADRIVTKFLIPLQRHTGGGTVGDVEPLGRPPLSRDDGQVLAAAGQTFPCVHGHYPNRMMVSLDSDFETHWGELMRRRLVGGIVPAHAVALYKVISQTYPSGLDFGGL